MTETNPVLVLDYPKDGGPLDFCHGQAALAARSLFVQPESNRKKEFGQREHEHEWRENRQYRVPVQS